jgi:hypothetical protein
MEVVKFVSAKPYLNSPDDIFDRLFFCLHGKKELVVECSDELKKVLKDLPTDYFQPRLKDIKAYLDKQGIKYVIEDLKSTTTI